MPPPPPSLQSRLARFLSHLGAGAASLSPFGRSAGSPLQQSLPSSPAKLVREQSGTARERRTSLASVFGHFCSRVDAVWDFAIELELEHGLSGTRVLAESRAELQEHQGAEDALDYVCRRAAAAGVGLDVELVSNTDASLIRMYLVTEVSLRRVSRDRHTCVRMYIHACIRRRGRRHAARRTHWLGPCPTRRGPSGPPSCSSPQHAASMAATGPGFFSFQLALLSESDPTSGAAGPGPKTAPL